MSQSDTPTFNEMQTVKRHFFAMRNGVIADTLRKAGLPFRIIFGLNLPQINDIAAITPHTKQLAEDLWANKTTRESLLLAPMIMPKDEFSQADAMRWISEAPSTETVDILCLKLLKHLEFAPALLPELSEKADTPILQYAALRLAINMIYTNKAAALEATAHIIDRNPDDKTLAALAKQIYDCAI